MMTNDFWEYSRTTVSLIIIANLLAVFGVLVFDWGITELFVVYWIEAGVALLVGVAKTGPAKIVTLPLPDSRRESSIRSRRGSITVAGVPCYVRNAPQLLTLLFTSCAWLSMGLLAFYRSASPFAYSTTAATFPTVVGVASLLVCSQLVTVRQYFGDQRYRCTSVAETGSLSFTYTYSLAILVILIGGFGDSSHPLNFGWLAASPVVIAIGKTTLELLFRCRNRTRTERIDVDTDPFTVEGTVRQSFSLKAVTAELPPVSRPDSYPRTTFRPARSSILIASPFAGMNNHYTGSFFRLFLYLAGGVVIFGGPWPYTVALIGVAFVGFTISGLVLSYPKHATLEYECYDDQLVCYDYWLERAQWNLSYEDIEQIETSQSRVGRLLGYGTVIIKTTDDQPAKLAYLREYEDVADRLEQTRNPRQGSISEPACG